MKAIRTPPAILNLRWTPLFVAGAAACFHLAYAPVPVAIKAATATGYLVCLIELARVRTTRQAFYLGLVAGLLCMSPRLAWFWNIFGPGAMPLWLILAVWLAAFVVMIHAVLHRFGWLWAAALAPVLWTGLEYFRSELYYLKFSWLNIGYAFSGSASVPFHLLGMYGIGFLMALSAAFFLVLRWMYAVPAAAAAVLALGFAPAPSGIGPETDVARLRMAGVQMEFPLESQIPAALDHLIATFPEADLLVLSEYTLDGPVPESLKSWCREHARYLVVGGKEPAPAGDFYDTAFVVDPGGDIVFQQGKCVPIQFFKDGLPAERQELWDSPWGRIGICICYDLSYTRVTDRLIRMGAQAIIVPTMDVADWGRRQHELHALVAPVRAAEYNVPIFRVASSGISQCVDATGRVIASAGFPGDGEMLAAGVALGGAGSLPIDRWLAPGASGATVLIALWLMIRSRKERTAAATSAAHNPLARPVEFQRESARPSE